MELRLVLRAHSAFAAVSGGLAVLVPSFFGSVFPSLSTPDTLAFVVRIYAVLLTAQAPLLHGIRQVESRPGLSRFCAVYAGIFGGTAIVCVHSDFVLGVVREANQGFVFLWAGLCAVYAIFSTLPSAGVLFPVWSVAHMVMVTFIGLTALANPAACNVRYFLVPNEDAYNTVSRYYGVLILGMSFLAATATSDAAQPAWPSLRLGFSLMFAASGACLALLLVERSQLDVIGVGSLLMFLGLAFAYATARLPSAPAQRHVKRL